MAIDSSQPLESQVEVTLFGPGYGESVLIHVGNGHWVIVDSCIESGKSVPAALEYLYSIGVDPAESVKLIVATHWHDDHIRGLSQLVEQCEKAVFSCSMAFNKSEFVSVITRYNKNNTTITGSGAKEIYKVYNLLNKRKAKLAVANTRIFSINSDELSHGCPVSVWALSPSDQQVDRFLLSLASQIPKFRHTKRRAAAPTPNDGSLVNLIEIGSLGILLGADLEEEGQDGTGWSAIIKNRDEQHNQSMIFKVAHHGSKTGHHDEVWSVMLKGSPYALITPWNRNSGLPTIDDVDRITSFTEHSYLTSIPKQLSSKTKRSSAVERMVKEVTGAKLRRSEAAFGVIRLRSASDDFSDWTVDLSDTACPLDKLKTA